ncbi:SLC13 family permease [Pseudohongiella sp.]|uniref:RCK C-terminal domain-containing protein n=1 Tax=marine sediment metagenome TaxID=412755 RepID=A0A0F9W5Q8_9ZZZZ|nr:SLC13 family permease [Pseudohongiella sp.]HDZ09681.1 SLC13 family permease [Pseudohongiella sp.]HEA61870.1 SLC13 family permease [Pseudohongiella sp.]
MTVDQLMIIAILVCSVGMFMWGRWRHDMVAGGALLACILTGLVPSAEAFAGFGHPAVVTVACVLVLSYGLQVTGAVDALAQKVLPAKAGQTFSIFALTALAAVLSGFMNNVGALALLMPVAIQVAVKQNLPPGRVLMPLAFGSILGGTTTLIGTPPNLIVSGFREEAGMGHFAMFDFTPVGLSITVVGILFVGLIGWRLVPARRNAESASFDTGTYLTEVRIQSESKAVGKTLREVEVILEKADAQIVGLVRGEVRVIAPYSRRVLREHDILVIEAEPESLGAALSSLGLKLEEEVLEISSEQDDADEEESGDARKADSKPARSARRETGTAVKADSTAGKNSERSAEKGSEKSSGKNPAKGAGKKAGNESTGEGKSGTNKEGDADTKTPTKSDELVIQELVVMPGSPLQGRSATDIELRTRYGINLLAVSRQGRRSIKRLRSTSIQAGDVLLMQGVPEAVSGFAGDYRCVPLATRDIRVPVKGQAVLAVAIFLAAISVTALGLLPVAVSFSAAVLAYMAVRIVPPRAVYDAIDWPVIVLLGALLPVAGAMASTGTADVLATALLDSVAQGNPVVALALVLIVTMTLSDFMNNAATAAVMCPLAISIAAQLGVNPDSYLMAVAIGASCAFLTPIGHQNNTLILGPSGFKFGDYWRLGLPVEIVVVAVSMPVLLWVWPL